MHENLTKVGTNTGSLAWRILRRIKRVVVGCDTLGTKSEVEILPKLRSSVQRRRSSFQASSDVKSRVRRGQLRERKMAWKIRYKKEKRILDLIFLLLQLFQDSKYDRIYVHVIWWLNARWTHQSSEAAAQISSLAVNNI